MTKTIYTPEVLQRGGTEHGMQRAVFAWSNCAYYMGFEKAWLDETYDGGITPGEPLVPEMKWYHAIHNQGHGDAIRGGQAKAEGVKKGVPDTFLPVTRRQWPGLYIENKLPKYENHHNGGLSDEQVDAIKFMRAQGYAVVVSHSWRSTALALQLYIAQGQVMNSRY